MHGVSGAFTLGVLFNLGPRIGKYTREGLARTFRPHNIHMTLMGLMLIFTGFYGFYAACLVIASTAFPGWANIYLSPTTLGSIAMIITFGFAGGFTGGYFASRGDPFWTVSGGLAGRDQRLGGRRRLRADDGVPARDALTAVVGRLRRKLDRGQDARRRRRRGGCGARRWRASWGCIWVGIFAAGYPTGLNNVESSIGGQLIGIATFLPLGFLIRLVRVLGAQEVQPAARPAGGRDRRTRRRPSTNPTSTCRSSRTPTTCSSTPTASGWTPMRRPPRRPRSW